MNFKFYNQLSEQPDLQDIVQYIYEPLQVLSNLETRLNNLSKEEIGSVSFAEISNKVERLINKHFPHLTEDYCKLSLEYRNTAIIKKEFFEGETHEYTSKDILLKNFSKLIEEIHILEHEFNNNYSHKLLVAHRIVDQMGVKKKAITTESEIDNVKPVVLKNNFDYENFKKSQPKKIIPVVEKKIVIEKEEAEEAPSISKDNVSNVSSSFFGISFMEVIMIITTLTMIVIMATTMSRQAEEKNNVNKAIAELEYLNSAMKEYTDYNTINIKAVADKGLISKDKLINDKYKNVFDGEIVVAPATLNSTNDTFSIATTNIPQKVCSEMIVKMEKEVQNKNKLLVNDTLVNPEGNLDFGNVMSACSLDNNTIKIVSQ